MYMTCTNKDRSVKIMEVRIDAVASVASILVSDLQSHAEMTWYDSSVVVQFLDGGLRLVVGSNDQINQVKERVATIEKLR